MEGIILPVGIQADIDEGFCYTEDKSYQVRAHEYLRRYEVPRGHSDTAVQAVVIDLCQRSFEAGAQCSGSIGATVKAEMLETAAKLVKCASVIEEA